MSCPCIACEREGIGACGCLQCGECGLESIAPLEWNHETLEHYCARCAPAKRARLVENAIAFGGGAPSIVKGGRWVPLKAKGRRRKAA